MSVSSATTVAPATAVIAPWMRAAILFQALSQGFTHSQKGSNLDTFTKGTTVVEVSWSMVVNGATITVGKASPKSLASGHKGKLQLITRALGHRNMTVDQTWNASDLFTWTQEGGKVKATRDQLKELAPTLFKAI